VVRALRSRDLVHHQINRELLVALESELLTLLDFRRGDRQQLTGWRYRGAEKFVRVRCAGHLRVQSAAEELVKSCSISSDKQLAVQIWPEVKEVCHCFSAGRVVQIRRAGNGVLIAAQGAGEVDDVRAVVPDLPHGMRLRPAGLAVDLNEIWIVLPPVGRRPLLELDNHVGRQLRVRVDAGEDNIGALRGQRQLILDEHLDVAQTGIHEVLREHGKATFPRPHLSRCRASAGLIKDLLEQPLCHRIRSRSLRQRGSGIAERQRRSPGSTNRFVRVGAHLRRSGASSRQQRQPVGPQQRC
jgi:hypothetical protein